MIYLQQNFKRKWLFILGLMVFIPCSGRADQGVWLVKTRIHQGFEYDNNAEMSRDNQLSDGLVKIIVNSQARYIRHSRYAKLSYHGGLQYYFRTSTQHKQIHQVNGFYRDKLFSRVYYGAQGLVRLKLYHHINWQYNFSNINPFLLFDLNLFLLRFSSDLKFLNYFNYRQFDFQAQQFKLAVEKRLNRRWFARFEAGRQVVDFQRPALNYDPVSGEVQDMFEPQQDHNYHFAFYGSYQKRTIQSLEYVFQSNSSNSYGFSYILQRITYSATFPLSRTILLRILAGIEIKKYDQQLEDVIRTTIDSELENNNFFILDYSIDITPTLSTVIRCAWFDNESPVPGRYYQKILSSISCEYRF